MREPSQNFVRHTGAEGAEGEKSLKIGPEGFFWDWLKIRKNSQPKGGGEITEREISFDYNK